MNNFYKVKGHENLFRDPVTGSILSQEKQSKNILKEKFESTSQDINSLKEEIRELKLLLLEHIKKHG